MDKKQTIEILEKLRACRTVRTDCEEDCQLCGLKVSDDAAENAYIHAIYLISVLDYYQSKVVENLDLLKRLEDVQKAYEMQDKAIRDLAIRTHEYRKRIAELESKEEEDEEEV